LLETGVDKPTNEHHLAFSALTLLIGQNTQPVKMQGAGVVICLELDADDLHKCSS